MAIVGVTGNYVSCYAQNKNVEEATKKNNSTKADKNEEYYEKLCKKFPDISFNTNGGMMTSKSNKVVVNISSACIEKMANDPEFAKQVEWNLSGEVAANSLINSWAKRDGVEIGARQIIYDANGNRQSSCGGMRTANPTKQKSNNMGIAKESQ